jgi:hypothetical protein
MNIFKLFNLSSKALTIECELSLAFQFGVMLDLDPSVININSKLKGPFFKSFIFIYNVFKRINFFQRNMKYKDSNVLFYAGTRNQLNSLSSTITSTKSKNIPCYVVAQNSLSKEQSADVKIELSLKVLLVALALFFKNVIPLYNKLKKEEKYSGIRHAFHVFCYTYIYLPYFLDLLVSHQKPLKLVVMSNDHNVENRCLRLTCELLKVKTLYVQHASVSELFPPLMFDYALLDGEIALSHYNSCVNNLKLGKEYATTVFFSGQKKKLQDVRPSFSKANTNAIGIAVNSLDNYEEVTSATNRLIKCGYRVVIRTHPRQNTEFRNKLNQYISINEHVYWSDSKKEDICVFFSSIIAVIAANSSIHLEAALAGLATFYMEFGDSTFEDYYGFIARGVSLKLDIENINDSIVYGLNYIGSYRHKVGLKMYSETYDTVWFGREGELTALIIDCILSDKPLNKYFALDKNNNKTYRLVMSN